MSSTKEIVCDNCGDGSGWDWHPTYGWVACADCNDDMQKPKPEKREEKTRAWEQS